MTSQEERSAIVLQGIHGLQFYANQYWVAHFLSYLGLKSRGKESIPHDLLVQMDMLLRFNKDTEYDLADLGGLDPDAFKFLVSEPEIKIFLIKLSSFRTQLNEGKVLKGQSELDDGMYLPMTNPSIN